MKPGPGARAPSLSPPPPPPPRQSLPLQWLWLRPLLLGALAIVLALALTPRPATASAATPARYHIRRKPCAAAGDQGTCMFVWECLRAGGRPLGVCVDHFMFGSCCAATDADNAVEDSQDSSSSSSSSSAHHGSPAPPTLLSAGSTPSASWVRPPPPPPPAPNPAAPAAAAAASWRPPAEPQFVTRPRPPAPPRPPPPPPPPPPPTSRPTPIIIVGTATSPPKPSTHKPTSWKPSKPSSSTTLSSRPPFRPGTRPRPRPTRRPLTTTTTTPTSTSTTTTTTTSTTSTTTTTTTTTTSTPPSQTTVEATASASSQAMEAPTTPGPGPTSTVAALNANQGQDTPCGVAPLIPRPETRIVGGKNAPFGGWPWQVSVRRTSFFGFSSTHRCGGALLNEAWVATAGHCVDDLLTSQIRVRLGEHDFASTAEPLPMVERGVARKVVHPRYNFFTYEYDLALLRLEAPSLTFAPHIAPVCLPASDDLLVGENATVTGWGRLSEGGALPSVLQEVAVPIVSNDKCKSMFLRAGRHEFIPDIFLCAGHESGGQDSCQGDSGGPLQVRGRDGRYFLAGIISWGIGCAEANLPGVCTRISKFVPWILENVRT